jgi:hypothetical protein
MDMDMYHLVQKNKINLRMEMEIYHLLQLIPGKSIRGGRQWKYRERWGVIMQHLLLQMGFS